MSLPIEPTPHGRPKLAGAAGVRRGSKLTFGDLKRAIPGE